MDANLQQAHQLADRDDWSLGTGAAWDSRQRMLRIASSRVPSWSEDAAAGAARVEQAPGSIDRFGTRAVVRATATTWSVVATGAAPGEVTLINSSVKITDAAIGHDDVLYVAMGDHVRMHDLRGRWPDADVPVPGGAWRLAPADHGCYVLGAAAAASTVGRVIGTPLRPLPFEYSGDVFRPSPEDPDPPRFEPLATVPAGVTAAGIATSPGGTLALLGWNATGNASVFMLGRAGFGAPLGLAGATHPYSLTWIDGDRIAVLIATSTGTTVGVYAVDTPGTASPVGDLYPLRAPTGEPFFHGTEVPPQYPSSGDTARPLVPVSWPSFADRGVVTSAQPLDAQAIGSTWHRIYLEAAIPPGTSIRVWLAANDERVTPPAAEWFEHRFGDMTDLSPGAPIGAWVDEPSEVPFHAALLPCPARPGVAGLFTALVQRAALRVRALAGRFLWVRVELVGDGRTTPELCALRIYSGRRGYAGLYLPELYREDTFGTEADQPAAATPADFLDRMLGMFESVMTPLEDRIASAWLLTTPKLVPSDAIDWLASWIGFVFAADLPEASRRAMLDRAWELYQKRGTLPGLKLALDLASRGGVSRGEIVVVEDFRLRRTFATILGADFADPGDPLLPGLITSGNSIVGKALFVGEEDQREFLALFSPDAEPSGTDEQAILDFYDRLAHRATVLVHQEVEEQDLGLLQQIIDLEAPAHVEVKLVTASYRFLVSVASLVGVDTFLAPKPAPGPVTLDHSQVGLRDLIQRLPSLDPRMGRSS